MHQAILETFQHPETMAILSGQASGGVQGLIILKQIWNTFSKHF
jgi:hypothetical protein